jgi:hypothetical protein
MTQQVKVTTRGRAAHRARLKVAQITRAPVKMRSTSCSSKPAGVGEQGFGLLAQIPDGRRVRGLGAGILARRRRAGRGPPWSACAPASCRGDFRPGDPASGHAEPAARGPGWPIRTTLAPLPNPGIARSRSKMLSTARLLGAQAKTFSPRCTAC